MKDVTEDGKCGGGERHNFFCVSNTEITGDFFFFFLGIGRLRVRYVCSGYRTRTGKPPSNYFKSSQHNVLQSNKRSFRVCV